MIICQPRKHRRNHRLLLDVEKKDEIHLFEHGVPKLTPFLGRFSEGKQGIEEYFAVVSNCLSDKNASFSDCIIDME